MNHHFLFTVSFNSTEWKKWIRGTKGFPFKQLCKIDGSDWTTNQIFNFYGPTYACISSCMCGLGRINCETFMSCVHLYVHIKLLHAVVVRVCMKSGMADWETNEAKRKLDNNLKLFNQRVIPSPDIFYSHLVIWLSFWNFKIGKIFLKLRACLNNFFPIMIFDWNLSTS